MIPGRRGCHQIQRTLAGEAIRLWGVAGGGGMLTPTSQRIGAAVRSDRRLLEIRGGHESQRGSDESPGVGEP